MEKSKAKEAFRSAGVEVWPFWTQWSGNISSEKITFTQDLEEVRKQVVHVLGEKALLE